MTEQRRALVFGGSGFIGRHLVAELSLRGWTVAAAAAADRDQSRRMDWARTEIVDVPSFDFAGIQAAVRATNPTVVFNLVAGGTDHSGGDPLSLVHGNVGFIATLMDALEASDVTKVVHTGSWSEYADPNGLDPIDEDHPLRPTSAYGAAKAGAALMGAALGRAIGLPFVVLRLFNIYGEGEAKHRLLPSLTGRLSHGDSVDLTPGRQVRDFVYVRDATQAIVTAAETIESASHFNVATGVGTAVREIAEMAASALGAEHDLLRFGALEARLHEPTHIIGDPTRFAAATDWRATTSVEAGVQRTIAAIVENKSTRR